MLKDLLFPKSCFGCGKWGHYVCRHCRNSLLATAHQRCIVCQKSSLNGWTHPGCRRKYSPERLLSVFDYQDKLIAQLINTAKLSLAYDLLEELTEIAFNTVTVNNQLLAQFVLCPIPQTRIKLRKRGYNHSEVIANIWSRELCLPVDKILIKLHKTKEQKQLNKQQRQQNLKDSFTVNQAEHIPEYILLIDDITTTGATFKETAKVLLRAGAKKVWCLALAQDWPRLHFSVE